MRKAANKAWDIIQKEYKATFHNTYLFSSIPKMWQSDKLVAEVGWSGNAGCSLGNTESFLKELEKTLKLATAINKANLTLDYNKPCELAKRERARLRDKIYSGKTQEIVAWLISTGE